MLSTHLSAAAGAASTEWAPGHAAARLMAVPAHLPGVRAWQAAGHPASIGALHRRIHAAGRCRLEHRTGAPPPSHTHPTTPPPSLTSRAAAAIRGTAVVAAQGGGAGAAAHLVRGAALLAAVGARGCTQHGRHTTHNSSASQAGGVAAPASAWRPPIVHGCPLPTHRFPRPRRCNRCCPPTCLQQQGQRARSGSPAMRQAG